MSLQEIQRGLSEGVRGLARLTRTGPLSFSLTPAREGGLRARVEICEDWIFIQASIGTCGATAQLQRWLRLNALFQGPVKILLTQERREGLLRAELPVSFDEANLTRNVAPACRAFFEAARWLTRNPFKGHHQPAPRVDDGLRALLEESSGDWTERSPDRFARTIEIKGEPQPLFIESQGAGASVLWVDLAAPDSPHPACEEALAVMLLLTSGQLRLARPAYVDEEGAVTARLLTRLTCTTAESLGEAVLALRAGAGTLLREAHVLLQNETVARQYLHMKPRASLPETSTAKLIQKRKENQK